MTTIIVMLIWMGGGNGGPATVTGFHSRASCEAAIPQVLRQIDVPVLVPNPRIRCLEITP